MKKRLVGLIAITYAFILFLGGCRQLDEKYISEGSIEFDAEVVDPNSFMASFAPKKMTVNFKNNKSCAEMSALMGVFTTSFISDPKTKTLTQLVQFGNKKFAHIKNGNDLNKDNELFNVEIIPTDSTKIIAGYKCKKAIVHYKGGDFPDYDIYYTQELNIEHPNFANLYHMVDGVLMDYQIKKFGLEMRFTAKSVKKDNIDDAIFERPAEYKLISEKEMNEFFEGLQ